MEIGEQLNLREIEAVFARFRICPKCASEKGFWLGLRSNRACAQCKHCGAEFDLFEVYPIADSSKKGFWRILLRK
jgi:transcription elongation factor Elf1